MPVGEMFEFNCLIKYDCRCVGNVRNCHFTYFITISMSIDRKSYLGESVDGGAVKTVTRGEGGDITRRCVMLKEVSNI